MNVFKKLAFFKLKCSRNKCEHFYSLLFSEAMLGMYCLFTLGQENTFANKWTDALPILAAICGLIYSCIRIKKHRQFNFVRNQAQVYLASKLNFGYLSHNGMLTAAHVSLRKIIYGFLYVRLRLFIQYFICQCQNLFKYIVSSLQIKIIWPTNTPTAPLFYCAR